MPVHNSCIYKTLDSGKRTHAEAIGRNAKENPVLLWCPSAQKALPYASETKQKHLWQGFSLICVGFNRVVIRVRDLTSAAPIFRELAFTSSWHPHLIPLLSERFLSAFIWPKKLFFCALYCKRDFKYVFTKDFRHQNYPFNTKLEVFAVFLTMILYITI